MTTTTMKAWQVTEWGEPESMHWNEVATPHPKAGQILIQVRAAALNFFDILQIQGKYQIKPPFPFTPGAEVAGIVEAVGEDVIGFAKGDAVAKASTVDGGVTRCFGSASCRSHRSNPLVGRWNPMFDRFVALMR